ncbi:hypothetical protein CAEBREN_13721 [Caenorhabditis brenneri]|uniref:F-box domain-containing protein n=1 Tax=Caenorhabditis brenneri TaxID=135651 RepID=G0MHG1_CAEBE|nr:hypothetical protein CAEBREN_13721 [Caenorhabditis brenneri]
MAEDPPTPNVVPEIQHDSGLTKLPLEIAQLVYGKIDMIDRFRLRKVCRTLKQTMDNMAVNYQLLRIRATDDCFIIWYDTNRVEYRGREIGCEVQREDQNPTVFPRMDYVEIAKIDLETILSNTRAHFLDFDIDFQCDMPNILALRKITALMQEIKQRNNLGFSVKSLNIEVNELIDYMTIVDMMRCDQLEEIRTDIFPSDPLCLTLISDMDQWKGLKKLSIKCNNLVIDEFDAFANLEEFTTEFLFEFQEVEELLNILERSSNFKECTLKFPYCNVRKLGTALNAEIHYGLYGSHQRPIPGTDDYLRCRLSVYETEIKKKSIHDPPFTD